MNRLITAGLILSALLNAPSARAGVKEEKAAIRKMYAQLDAAVKKRDLRPMAAAMTPDFELHYKSGQKWNKSQALRAMEVSFKMAPNLKYTPVRIHSLTVSGARAVVVASVSGTTPIADPQNPRKVHTMLMRSQTRDFWVKSGGAWKQKRSEEVAITTFLDGQKVPNPPMSAPPQS